MAHGRIEISLPNTVHNFLSPPVDRSRGAIATMAPLPEEESDEKSMPPHWQSKVSLKLYHLETLGIFTPRGSTHAATNNAK